MLGLWWNSCRWSDGWTYMFVFAERKVDIFHYNRFLLIFWTISYTRIGIFVVFNCDTTWTFIKSLKNVTWSRNNLKWLFGLSTWQLIWSITTGIYLKGWWRITYLLSLSSLNMVILHPSKSLEKWFNHSKQEMIFSYVDWYHH